jgi:4'-phosphopantetheinyl transferase EntD
MAGGARRDELDCAPLRAALDPFGVLVGARRIRPGDEAAFTGPWGSTAVNPARLRASGAARIVARSLLSELGADAQSALLRSPSGAPVWPEGILGSLAHDDAFAVAAIARRGTLIGLGIDVEPAEPLPVDLVDLVLSPTERVRTAGDGVRQRLVFVAKEAVYKAIHPLDGTPLEYDDIEIALGDDRATLRDGRGLRLMALAGPRLVAVALAFDREAARAGFDA